MEGVDCKYEIVKCFVISLHVGAISLVGHKLPHQAEFKEQKFNDSAREKANSYAKQQWFMLVAGDIPRAQNILGGIWTCSSVTRAVILPVKIFIMIGPSIETHDQLCARYSGDFARGSRHPHNRALGNIGLQTPASNPCLLDGFEEVRGGNRDCQVRLMTFVIKQLGRLVQPTFRHVLLFPRHPSSWHPSHAQRLIPE